MVCRIKTIQASRSHVSHVGQALGDDPLENAKGPLFKTIKIAVIDIDRLLKQRDYGRTDNNRSPVFQFYYTPYL